MKNLSVIRSPIFYVLLSLSISTLACVALNGPVPTLQPPSPQSPIPQPSDNGLIAYLGTDGNLYTIDGQGENQTAITEDAQLEQRADQLLHIYTHPTWALDGRQLAFVSTEARGPQFSSHLLVADTESAEITDIFASSTETPFYLYWAPDNERISFLTNSTDVDELLLRLAFFNGDESRILDGGQPYYWVWAPDGSEILIHDGGSTAANPAARLGYLSPESLATRTFSIPSGNFQAPGWSPDGKHLLVATVEGGQGQLIQLDKEGNSVIQLAEFRTAIAFSWSPDGEYVAYLPKTSASGGRLGQLSIIPTGSAEVLHTTRNNSVIAYFWAPDSQKIAYYSVQISRGNQEDISMRTQEDILWLDLNVLDIRTGETRTLSSFQLSNEFLSILTFFDQYHHSGTIWSPDSAKLVYTTNNPDGRAGIWVVDAEGAAQPLRLAEGTLAFWSWK